MGVHKSGKITQKLEGHAKKLEFPLGGGGEVVKVRIGGAVWFNLCLGNRWLQ